MKIFTNRGVLKWLFFAFTLFILIESKIDVPSVCPNDCSGRGVCSSDTVSTCLCHQGFVGVDCSLRVCPANRAWVDIPTDDNVAHGHFTECSNMGSCDRKTGLCNCRRGFTGPACDMMLCPFGNTLEATFTYSKEEAICSGNGKCLSLRQLSKYHDYTTYLGGGDWENEYTAWDADRIYGCLCDEGWTGVACDQRICPFGDDPATTSAAEAADEVQLFECQCDTCGGGFYFGMNGEETEFVPYDSPPEILKYRLEVCSSFLSFFYSLALFFVFVWIIFSFLSLSVFLFLAINRN
jgi:hypothetical protein